MSQSPGWPGKGSPSSSRSSIAEPVVTSSPHSLFGNSPSPSPSPSSSSYRSRRSTGSLAASHLRSTMAEIDGPSRTPSSMRGDGSETGSIRSGKTLMMGGNGSGGGTISGRRRRVSSINSSKTATSRDYRDPPSASSGNTSGGETLELVDKSSGSLSLMAVGRGTGGSRSSSTSRKNSKELDRPESKGVVPQVVKRQKVEQEAVVLGDSDAQGKGKGKAKESLSSSEGDQQPPPPPPTLSRRSSWFGSRSPALGPTIATNDIPSIALPFPTSTLNPPPIPTPTATTTTSTSTPTPAPSSPTKPLSTPTSAPTPSSPVTPHSPAIPRVTTLSSASNSPSRRASWFGRAPPPPQPVFLAGDATSSLLPIADKRESSPMSSREQSRERPRNQDEEKDAGGTIKASKVTSSKKPSSGEALSIPLPPPPAVVNPRSTSPKPEFEDPNLTPKLTPRPTLPSSSNNPPSQRVSWWGWGYPVSDESTSTSTSTPPSSSEPITAPPTTEVEAPEMVVSASASESSFSADGTSDSSEVQEVGGRRREVAGRTQVKRGWLQTIWGDWAEESNAESGGAVKGGVASTKPEEEEEEAQPRTSSELDEPPLSQSLNSDDPTPTPTPAPIIAPKASWSFFPSRHLNPSDASTPTSTSSSLQAVKPISQLSKSLASSRASSIASSAPPSPHLGPQADAPLKPLTGSLRNAPRGETFENSSSSLSPTAPIENLVLPTFHDSFLRPPRSFEPKKGKLVKAVSLVNSYFWSQPPTVRSPKEEEERVGKLKDDPAERLPKSWQVMGIPKRDLPKRVVTIGVHGWFPTPMIRSVLGEPTGTSVKFSTMMHDAVQSYLESNDLTSFNIQAIALEGEGEVDVRVEKLFQQLSKREEWVHALGKADVVFLATHSQGSVVSAQLLARMVEAGLVVGQRTHLLTMCAIAQGPFVYLNQSYALQPYFNYIESAAARELFEFQDPASAVTTKFLESLQIILSAGVKITVVGSINDQVTPLYSSLFAGINHPAILRAVYIDSAAFRTSDFLANLVVFASRLRNAGLKDHDLIYHLSEALAGALTGVGHSKIYEEEEVFKLAVRYQFETTFMAEAPTFLNSTFMSPAAPLAMSFNPRERRNPYLLTWALRGIIEDPQIRELFSNELVALREAFETWKPTTKVLKDVKLKLEGIRMLPLRPKKDGKL